MDLSQSSSANSSSLFAGAYAVRHGFHCVGEVHDRGEAKHPDRAVDGVHRAEHPVLQFLVFGRLLQGQQGVFHRLQQLCRLLGEDLLRAVESHAVLLSAVMTTGSPKWACNFSSSKTSKTAWL